MNGNMVHDIHHSRVCGDTNSYCGHPHQDGILNFGGDEIVVLHKHTPCTYENLLDVSHGVVHARAKVLMHRSLDGGVTWQEPSVIWDETAPLEERMAFLHSTGQRPQIDLSRPEAAIYFGRTRRHVEETESDMETFAIRTADRGHTWEEHPSIVRPPQWGEFKAVEKNGCPLVRLDDGYYLGAFYNGGDSDNETLLYGSGDEGVTWDYLARVLGDTPESGGMAYQGLLQVADGRLLLFTVNLGGIRHCLQVAESVDGYSWSAHRPIVKLGASPWLSQPIVPQSRYQLQGRVYYRSPWPVLLRDGRIIVLFGRRKPPHGIGVIVSEDNGMTWSREEVLRSDAPSSDIGYPVATELEDGRIFVAYYYNDEPGGVLGGPRYIAGTHFRLK
jgi:hypothetical protein